MADEQEAYRQRNEPHPSGQTEDEREKQQGLEETEDLRLSTILDNSLWKEGEGEVEKFMPPAPYFEIDPDPETTQRLRKERDKARELKRTPWWKQQLHKGLCHYCGQPFQPDQLSMDHVVPLARGGRSTKGNVVPSCVECNRKKKLETPAEAMLRKLARQRD